MGRNFPARQNLGRAQWVLWRPSPLQPVDTQARPGWGAMHAVSRGFFVYISIYLFFATPTGHIFSVILTLNGSYDMFLQPLVPFGGCNETAPHLGGQIPPKKTHFGGWIGVFKPNSRNRKTCILSKILHRFKPNFAQRQRPPNMNFSMVKRLKRVELRRRAKFGRSHT